MQFFARFVSVLALITLNVLITGCEPGNDVALINDTSSILVVQVEPESLNQRLRWQLAPGDEAHVTFVSVSRTIDFRIDNMSGTTIARPSLTLGHLRSTNFRVALSAEIKSAATSPMPAPPR